MKRLPWFEIILITVMTAMSLYGVFSDAQNFSHLWFTRDDAYYYFKVAQNISEGHGSTFDGINPTNGYHPLWMWICIPIFALARFDLILPLRILFLILNGLCVATGILLYRLVKRATSPPIGMLAGILWVFSVRTYGIVYQQGLETGIAAFCIVALLYSLANFETSEGARSAAPAQIARLAVLAVLVLFSRLDLVFFAALAGLWIIFRNHPLHYLLPFDVVSISSATTLAFLVRLQLPFYYDYSDAVLAMIVIGLIIKIPLAYFFGLHQPPATWKLSRIAIRTLTAGVVSSILIGGIMTAIASLGIIHGFPRVAVLYDAGLTFILFFITRLLMLGLRINKSDSQPTRPYDELHANWKRWLTEGAMFYGILGGALAIYMLWNKLAFGTSSPVSGQVKRWWGSFPSRVYGGSTHTILGFFGLDSYSESSIWEPVADMIRLLAERLYKVPLDDVIRYLILVVLFLLFLYLLLFMDRRKGIRALTFTGLIPLAAGAMPQIISYNIAGYANAKDWYWVGEMLAILITTCISLHMLTQILQKYRYTQAALTIVVGMIAISMGLRFWKHINSNMPYGFWKKDAPYMSAAQYLEKNTEPGSIIGMTGGGNIGYFIHDRTIVNMDGLINSNAYFQALQEKRAGKYLADISLQYVFANYDIVTSLPYTGQYDAYLEKTGLKYGGKDLMRFHSAKP